MKESPKKKNRFFAFLTALCAPKFTPEVENIKKKSKCKPKINKTPRLTFILDRVLVKVSRKNIAQQQFMENQVLTFHLEKYIAARLKECDIVVFSGEFSTFLTQKIPFSIQLKRSQQEAFQSLNNYILTNPNNHINLNFSKIDAMVFQLYFGEIQESTGKSSKSGKSQQTKQNSCVISDLDKIQQILRFYHKKVKSFVFICHKDLRLEDIHSLFLVFRQIYLFQFQRVKKIQKLVCNIIYVSFDPRFLKIDRCSLSQFVIDEFEKIKAYQLQNQKNVSTKNSKQNNNMNRTTMQSLQKNKKSVEQLINSQQIGTKRAFQQLIQSLLERNLHIPVTQALGTILDSLDKKTQKISWFISIIQQKCPSTKDIIEKYKKSKFQNDHDQPKTCNDFTPVFQVKPFQSKQFSKMTALFKTHHSGEDDDFIFSNQRDDEQFSF